MEHILINCTPREVRVAIVVDGVLQDLFIERDCARGLVGNVYLGKVVRVLPGMQSAFVDVGLERTAFLHVADIAEAHCEGEKPAPIETILHEGQSLMVQVAKDPIGTKGARLTTTVSLAGRKLVYLPRDNHIGVSQRIEDAELRESLRAMMTELRPETEKGGYIIRTSAEEGATEQEFKDDMAYLGRLWTDIHELAGRSTGPKLLYQDLSLAQRVLRDMVHQDTQTVEVDSRENYEALLNFASRFVPAAKDRLTLYRGERPLFELHGIETEIEHALERRVDLKSGGYLVFDQTEAMTTIDVNTGGYVGKRDFSDTVFKTNLEAAQTIARQLRLRNLGGIIIVDFIDMNEAENRQKLYERMCQNMQKDRARHNILPLSKFGLMQITRQRVRPAMDVDTTETCPTCFGKGRIKSSILFTDTLESKIDYLANKLKIKKFSLHIHPYVAAYVNQGLVSLKRKWQMKYGLGIKVIPDQKLAFLQYVFYDPHGEEIDMKEEVEIKQ